MYERPFGRPRWILVGRGVRLLDFVGISETAVVLVPQVFINVDALESLPKDLLDILGSRRDIICESLSTRTNLTGRPHVCDEVVKYFVEAIVVPVRPCGGDVKRYLEVRLDGDIRQKENRRRYENTCIQTSSCTRETYIFSASVVAGRGHAG